MIFAGTDTTASTLTTILQLLAQHQDVQDRLHNELQEARRHYGEEIPYDQLMALPLLDAVCRETLRMWVKQLLTRIVLTPFFRIANHLFPI